MAVREGLLALLDDRPRHGYDLRAEFDARTARLWNLNSGQVYTTLDRLERDGLVERGTPETDDRESDRRLPYAVTEAGRAELRRWLDAASWTIEPQRDELLMKVLLVADRPDRARQVVADHRRAVLERLQALRVEQRDLPDDLAAELAADALVARLDADLHWLDRCDQRLARREQAR